MAGYRAVAGAGWGADRRLFPPSACLRGLFRCVRGFLPLRRRGQDLFRNLCRGVSSVRVASLISPDSSSPAISASMAPTSARVSSGKMATARSAGVSASSDSICLIGLIRPCGRICQVPILRSLFSALSSTSSGWVDLVASMAFLIASVIVLYGFHIVSVYSGVVLLSPSVYRCKITMLVRWYADNRLLFLFPARRMR